ncbi:hypothetical protein X997_5467 [Burkholderia pseudomallei A79C]|nr:hypothetical protein X997_5467 [Burkholderia pseudomallei A79C]
MTSAFDTPSFRAARRKLCSSATHTKTRMVWIWFIAFVGPLNDYVVFFAFDLASRRLSDQHWVCLK